MSIFRIIALICLAACLKAHAEDSIPLGPIGELRAVVYLYGERGEAFLMLDRSDGGGPQLVRWGEATLGPRPTISELQAAAEHLAKIDAMRADLRTAYAAPSKGVQVFFQTTFAVPHYEFVFGNVTAGRGIVATTPVGSTLVVACDALLAIIDAAFPRP